MVKILIIEDEEKIRDNIKQILELADFETVVAENGKQGLEYVKDKNPHLIICDLMMPELDGYSVLSQLRQDIHTAGIPLIFLSAKSERSDLRRGMELGADDYLTKPFDADELLQAVNARLEKQSIVNQQTQYKIDALRGAITYSLPHEFNTPLNHIMCISDLLLKEYDSVTHKDNLEMLQMIHSSAGRLNQLTMNFLLYVDLEMTLSNPERLAEIRQNLIRIRIKDMIESTALQVAKKWERTDDLTLNITQGLINISPLKMTKVLSEVMDNAFKFSPAGTPVEIISQIIDGKFILYIIDYGRGMTEEQIANLGAYMQFKRTMYEQQGCGLGLSIAKQILQIYHGDLTIESIPGKQTIVRIVMPLVMFAM
jgi:two-component system sensor histidine kinase/response regulator